VVPRPAREVERPGKDEAAEVAMAAVVEWAGALSLSSHKGWKARADPSWPTAVLEAAVAEVEQGATRMG